MLQQSFDIMLFFEFLRGACFSRSLRAAIPDTLIHENAPS
jgi:hypothetical protein